MKKALLTLALALSTSLIFAQRSVDWSVEEILLPTELRSGNQTTPLRVNYKIVCKNNSTEDPVFASDTLGIQIICIDGLTGNTAIWAYPNLQAIAIAPIGKNCDPGDTVHISGSLNVALRVPLSRNIRFLVSVEVFNRKDMFPRELAATLPNNSKTNPMIWYCEQGWGVNVNNTTADLLNIYPNPTSNQLFIDLGITNVNSNNSISVVDMTGKEVIFENNVNLDGTYEINTSELSKGIYFLKVNNGSSVITKKFVIE